MRTGRTIAVIAGGIDQPYPPENADLHRRIAETNLLITEAPLGTVPQARHFPRRNRIIAGLSLGVVVVEAALRSGSLITARIAQEAGREVFAVPGSPLDPRARGGNDLIRQGAILVETAADVLDNLPLQPIGHPPAPTWFRRARTSAFPDRPSGSENPPEAHEQVLSLLSPEPTMVDDLVRRCHLSPSVTMAVLLELELAGRVETLPAAGWHSCRMLSIRIPHRPMSDVVVVESPAKAKTINRYLGGGYTVLASFGHVRDLPPKDGSVRPDQDFAMDWESDARGDKQVGAIAKALKGAKTLYLATDPDREGEAISWHVRAMLADKNALKGVDRPPHHLQ